ncbi:hypothetical protein NMG60_11027132 [Bertholletia excelsa]
MDRFALATATSTNNPLDFRFFLTCHIPTQRIIGNGSVFFRRRPCKFLVFASGDDPKMDKWDQMELKFGQLIGEDPKLTLAKIMARKANPDVSYLEVEKSFGKKKGKSMTNEVEEVPFEGSGEEQSSYSLSGLNLIRPVPKKGVKFKDGNEPAEPVMKKPSQSPARKPVDNNRGSLPNVILRKPTTFKEDDVEPKSKWRLRPNLSLKMGKGQTKEKFSDITLLRKPEPMHRDLSAGEKQEHSGGSKAKTGMEANGPSTSEFTGATNDVTLLKQPPQMDLSSNINEKQESSGDYTGSTSSNDFNLEDLNLPSGTANTVESNYDESMQTANALPSRDAGFEDYSVIGLQPFEQSEVGSSEKSSHGNSPPETKLVESDIKYSMEAALQGKPERLDMSIKGTSNSSREEKAFMLKPEIYGNAVELKNFLATSPIKEHEDNDWRRAEDLIKTAGREEVELISSSTRGFVVAFGSLIGFLPYRNLSARWKFLAFESWLRRKGLDPSKYKHNLGIIGNQGLSINTSVDSSPGPEIDKVVDLDISPDMQLEDLLRIYDQEKLKFLSSFVGQKIKVNVELADRKSRKLIFSVKPKEKEELVEKKRKLMAKLSIGDVVKCSIKKITYFGIFVEVGGVPALIHQTEVSWDATLDPASYFKVGQTVEAKVHQLDFSLDRIFLSLKETTPDPLVEALEAVIGDQNSMDARLQAAKADEEWAEVESLIGELQQFEGIQAVSKGRYFLSPGLAPTFQVYMASMYENEYKLLARSGNKVQEVVVQTSLGKEEMKSAILICTNRVQ